MLPCAFPRRSWGAPRALWNHIRGVLLLRSLGIRAAFAVFFQRSGVVWGDAEVFAARFRATPW
eukprot:15090401-Alexandrium_andersonii.AAC.1